MVQRRCERDSPPLVQPHRGHVIAGVLIGKAGRRAAALLAEAGLGEVTVRALRWQHRVDPERWWTDVVTGTARTGAIITHLDAEAAAAAKKIYDGKIIEYVDESGMAALPAVALLAMGRCG